MPKNKGKGGKNRRRGKNESDAVKRELEYATEDQQYGLVLELLGNGRLRAQLANGEKTLANIRGKMRKKVWITQGDIVLLAEREFEEGKTDVILKYNPDEVHQLKKEKELPDNFTGAIEAREAGEDVEYEDEIEFNKDEIDDI